MKLNQPIALRSRQKLAGLILFAAYAVSLCFLAAYGYHHVKGHHDERLLRAAELSHVLAEHAERTLSEADRDLQIAALLLQNEQRAWSSPERMHMVLRELAAGSAPIRYLVILDEDGQMIGDAGAFPPRAYNGADRDYFRRHREGESGLIIGRPIKSRSDGRWFFTLSRALLDQDGAFRGVALAAIDLHYLERFVQDLRHSRHDRIALIGQQGVIYYVDGMREADIGRLLPYWNPWSQGLYQNEILLESGPHDATVQPLGRYPLKVVIASASLSSVAEARNVLTEIAPVAAITLLLVSGLGFFLLHHTGRAERLLRDIAETMPGDLYRLSIAENGRAKILWTSYQADKFADADADGLSAARDFRVHPEDRRRCHAALLEAARQGRDLTLEARRILPDGSVRDFRATGRPRPEGSGWIFDGVIFDITEERRIADAVQASERRLAMVLDAAQDAIIALDQSLTITHFNKGAEVMFDLSAEEMIGQPLDRLLPPDVRDHHDDMLLEIVRGPDGARDMGSWREFRGLRRDGSEFPLLSSISKVTLPNGEAMLCSIMRDMTDLASTERRLTQLTAEQGRLLALAEQANHAKAKFLATMSHELRTPLNAIIGFSEAIDAQIFGPIGSDRYRGYVQDILSSGRHLLELINDILDLSKIQQNGTEFRFGDIDVRDVIADALIFVQRRASEKGVGIEVASEAASTEVLADERALRQILINLFGNALKFTPSGGTITVSLRERTDGWLTIQVDDTGPGVSPELLPRLGDPFVQDRDIYTGSSTGTGLGLAIVRELVAAHKGRIAFSNRPEGGFRIVVELPMAAAMQVAE